MTKPIRALALVLSFVAVACDDGGTKEEDNPRTAGILALTPDMANGMLVFTSRCGTAACHGPDGNTPGTPDTKMLKDEIPERDDRELVNYLLKGEGAMPPQTDLTDQQLADVLLYVRETFG